MSGDPCVGCGRVGQHAPECPYGLPRTEYYRAPMTGWICPVCGRGLSPDTKVCPCKDIPPADVPWSTNPGPMKRTDDPDAYGKVWIGDPPEITTTVTWIASVKESKE